MQDKCPIIILIMILGVIILVLIDQAHKTIGINVVRNSLAIDHCMGQSFHYCPIR